MSETDVLNLGKVIQDLYLGNGKPALTQRVSSLEEGADNMDGRMGRMEQTLNRIMWLIISTVALAVLNLVLKH